MNAQVTARVVETAPRERSAVAGHLVALSSAPDPLWAPVVVRLATQADQRSLDRLAQLDSTTRPAGDTVIGELQGRPVAAVSLNDGRAIADPFLPTAEIVALVRLRAEQLAFVAGHPPRRPR
jgi:hypothetical protein